ncbi:MAG TPA: protein kinase [Blastocatellia bacterium]
MIECPHCRQPLADNARFCHHCGASLSRDTAPHNASTAPAVVDTNAIDPLLGHTLEGKYKIISRLGAGGMGSVYRAQRVHIGDEVAVKVLLQEFVRNPAALERFRREARAAAMLQHPNIVTIHDYGETTEASAPAFIVMELVRGTSLRDIIDSEKRIAPRRSVALMKSICAGVGAAHRNEIVHRDIKPDNIIVLPHDEDEGERVKVLDFGIAKLRDMVGTAALTQTGTVIGTPYYMSPEQCKAEHLDARSDVYSLGAMMYEMLAGGPPFTAMTATGIVAKHLTQPPPPLPPELKIPADLEAVIMRALSKDPKDRQADATEFSRELQSAMLEQTAQSRMPVATTPVATTLAATRQADVSELRPPMREEAREQFMQTQKSSRAGLIAIISVAAVVVLAVAAGLVWMKSRSTESENKNATIASSNNNQSPPQTPKGTLTVEPASPPVVVPLPAPQSNANANTQTAPTDSTESEAGPEAMSRAESKILAGQRLTSADLEGLSQLELRRLRNTVYARHGRIFERPEMRRYFSTRSWYSPRPDYTDAELTAADQANVQLILQTEKTR